MKSSLKRSSIIQHATKMSREIIRRATIAKTEREKCFEDVKSIIQNHVIENGSNIKLSALSEMYKEYQEKLRLVIQNRNLKERLKNIFGNQMNFHQKAIGLPEIIYNTDKLNKVRLYNPIEILKEVSDNMSRISTLL